MSIFKYHVKLLFSFMITIPGYNKTLDQFTYADSFINDIIYECVGKTNFVGVAATIKFDKNGDLDETTQIDRIQSK